MTLSDMVRLIKIGNGVRCELCGGVVDSVMVMGASTTMQASKTDNRCSKMENQSGDQSSVSPAVMRARWRIEGEAAVRRRAVKTEKAK